MGGLASSGRGAQFAGYVFVHWDRGKCQTPVSGWLPPRDSVFYPLLHAVRFVHHTRVPSPFHPPSDTILTFFMKASQIEMSSSGSEPIAGEHVVHVDDAGEAAGEGAARATGVTQTFPASEGGAGAAAPAAVAGFVCPAPASAVDDGGVAGQYGTKTERRRKRRMLHRASIAQAVLMFCPSQVEPAAAACPHLCASWGGTPRAVQSQLAVGGPGWAVLSDVLHVKNSTPVNSCVQCMTARRYHAMFNKFTCEESDMPQGPSGNDRLKGYILGRSVGLAAIKEAQDNVAGLESQVLGVR